MPDAATLTVTGSPADARELEVRCPRCTGLAIKYRPAPATTVHVETRCRRCRIMFAAELAPTGPTVRELG